MGLKWLTSRNKYKVCSEPVQSGLFNKDIFRTYDLYIQFTLTKTFHKFFKNSPCNSHWNTLVNRCYNSVTPVEHNMETPVIPM